MVPAAVLADETVLTETGYYDPAWPQWSESPLPEVTFVVPALDGEGYPLTAVGAEIRMSADMDQWQHGTGITETCQLYAGPTIGSRVSHGTP